MKNMVYAILLAALLIPAGCSKTPASPEEQLTAVNEMLSRGYEMTDNQRREIDEQVNEAGSLLKAGKKTEASALLAKVLADLEVIGETDRFNKSE
jgi:hypothetical protein